jgi:hypothetical protein
MGAGFSISLKKTFVDAPAMGAGFRKCPFVDLKNLRGFETVSGVDAVFPVGLLFYFVKLVSPDAVCTNFRKGQP